eukprot:TRINITY_DN33841_c0_g1_i1.p1 TRINITY_DN33841_c0_g1~~TRINITY_DN33841_c0_g1_i1.p1  ORF type:complete len:852 (+),score=85.92 TRINITY_DN33841_c0_g1_i1:209-2764(+)
MHDDVSWEVAAVTRKRSVDIQDVPVLEYEHSKSGLVFNESYYKRRDSGFKDDKEKNVPPDLTHTSSLIPRSKRLSILALRGWKDLHENNGIVPGECYKRAPGLDPKVFRPVKNPCRRVLPLPLRKRPIEGTEKKEAFHTWYLREKRKAQATVEQGIDYYPRDVVDEESEERIILLKIAEKFTIFSNMAFCGKCPVRGARIMLVMPFLAENLKDLNLSTIALIATKNWVRDVATAVTFVNGKGILYLSNIMWLYQKTPVVVKLVTEISCTLLRYPQTHVQVSKSQILPLIQNTFNTYPGCVDVLALTVKCFHTIVSHTPTTEAVINICMMNTGLPAVIRTLLRFQSNERYVKHSLIFIKKVASYPCSHRILLEGNGLRIATGTSRFYPNPSFKRFMGSAIYSLSKHRKLRNTLCDHGFIGYLLECILEDNKPFAAQVDALYNLVSNPLDRSAMACPLALPPVLGALLQQPDTASLVNVAKIEACLKRTLTAQPLLTTHAASLRLHPILYTMFRPPEDIYLHRQLSATGHERLYTATYRCCTTPVVATCLFIPKATLSAKQHLSDRFFSNLTARFTLYHPNICNLVAWASQECIPFQEKREVSPAIHIVHYSCLEGGKGLRCLLEDKQDEIKKDGLGLLLDTMEGCNELRVLGECGWGGLKYKELYKILSDILLGLRYLERCGVGYNVSMQDIYEEGGTWKVWWEGRDPDPTLSSDGFGRVLADILFFAAPAARMVFDNCGACPGEFSPLLLNALLAPSHGRSSYTDVSCISATSRPSVTPTQLLATLEDIVRLSAFKTALPTLTLEALARHIVDSRHTFATIPSDTLEAFLDHLESWDVCVIPSFDDYLPIL